MHAKNFSKTNTSQVILYGRHAVLSALKNPKRQIIKLMILPENEADIKKECPTAIYQITSKKDLEKILPPTAVHQGFALITKPLEPVFLEDLIKKSRDLEACRILILDQVTDPQNIGAIIRSAAAFNALGVIVQDKNAPFESGAMAKAAAGTMELTPLVRTTNLSRTIETLKKNGFWIVGMDGYATQKIDEVDKSSKLAVIMGSEGSGMRRLVEENCDLTVRLDINKNVESLNVSVAAAIVLYELSKK
ncbi:MAG: 23S rRNA (guanosine(2251)-2'-O)-methyltransferase RlmB [Alphaproteobacteria bacterium]|nr:23S rRNA (guanosine(2251)-2'-O)-methyltransferase RlmB [Alphaproteobacteria bacterium]